MRFSTGLPGLTRYPPTVRDWERTATAADFQRMARTADELGFDSISVPEHFVVPDAAAETMGGFWPHALTAMAFVAGATTRLIVDSSVIVLPLHDPIALAKAVSTLDLLSGGRVRVSFGVGSLEREFETLGVAFHQRGRIADEYLAAMIELWTSEHPVFHGQHVDFQGIVFAPKPVQKPHPPIWIGGSSPAAMRRAARHDGWFPNGLSLAQLTEGVAFIRSQPEFGSPTRPFDLMQTVSALVRADGTPSTAQAVVDAVGALQASGVTWTSVPVSWADSVDDYLDGLHWIAEEVMPHVR
jgi:probable F420-dependent oxidoreductase